MDSLDIGEVPGSVLPSPGPGRKYGVVIHPQTGELPMSDFARPSLRTKQETGCV